MMTPLSGAGSSPLSGGLDLSTLLSLLGGQGQGAAGRPLPNAAPTFGSGNGSASGMGAMTPSLQGPQMPGAAPDNSAALIAALLKGNGQQSSGQSGGKGGGKSGGGGLMGGLGNLLGGAGKGAGAGAAGAGIGSDALASYGPMLADIAAGADI